MKVLVSLFFVFLVSGCVAIPENIKPVNGFQIDRYLGKWYEIARLDHSFERGLDNVTATYSLREDGGVNVVNRGYSSRDKEWSDANGKAYFVNDKNEGYLKVSFFGPFYGSYIVFELDQENYEYAFVSGPDLSYLWLLSRKPNLNQEVMDRFVAKSKSLGFDVNELIFVSHD